MSGVYTRGSISKTVIAVTVLMLSSLFSFATAQTTDQPLTNVFSLSASATGEAANDLMRATVVVQVEGEDAAELQSIVNATMQWAVARMRPYTQIDTETQDYQTYPTYDRNHKNIIGWRASQSLQLETEDVKAAGEAIRKLQERMQVQGIRFEPKPSTRTAVENQLINDALDAFKRRAQLIRLNIGAPSYTLLDVDVQTGSQRHFRAAHDGVAMMRESVSEPAFESGTSQITVSVHGRIQLGDAQ